MWIYEHQGPWLVQAFANGRLNCITPRPKESPKANINGKIDRSEAKEDTGVQRNCRKDKFNQGQSLCL